MMMVLHSGMSRPFSMMVVATRMSDSWRMKASITRSSSLFAHLAVADDDARLGHHLADLGGDLVDGLHAVVDEVDLAAALQFLLDGRADQLLVECATTVWIARRSLGGVSITLMSRRPSSDMCSVRGIGVADMVSTSTSLRSCFSRSLWRTPKRCSSSTITRPEVAELDVLREQAMRADDDVDLARLELRQRFLLLLRSAEAAEHLDLDGKRREALLEGVEVLEGEHRGGREHRDLLAVAAPP